MVKLTLQVDGMACGMCEAHVNDAVRRNFAVKKVESSHAKGRTVILAEQPIDEGRLREVITALGYTVGTVQTEPYEKKRFSIFGK